MKHLLLFTVLAATAVCAHAQKMLQAAEVPNPLVTAYMNEPGEYRARVDVKCLQTIPLTFETQCDKPANLRLTTEDDGVNTTYTMLIDADPSVREYSTRMLTIASPGYDDIYYDLSTLRPGQWITISVSDPNITVGTGCYNEHHNKGMEEIKNMNYEEARRQFYIASSCAEANQEENNNWIERVDSLIRFRLEGDNAFKLLDYRTAAACYDKVLILNSLDSYALNMKTQCVKDFSSECETLFNRAEWLYKEHDYQKAKEVYQQLLDRKCNYEVQANNRLQSIASTARSRKDHTHVLTYEWQKNVPIGLHIGTYNMHKAGGYFHINLNATMIDAIRQECRYEDPATTENIKYPEFNISAGWTIKIKNPVWVHFGPGFTGKMYYGKYKEDNYPYYDKNEADPLSPDMTDPAKKDGAYEKVNFGLAISPEVGITIKYSYFAVRCTYQYRFALKKPLQEFIEPHRVSVGVGIAF
ncbi:MAG: hypothetical protein IJT30_10590 [Muribaculaceae bacterium]|nr:hypothetical protein [Muribaculaceae bacterium]